MNIIKQVALKIAMKILDSSIKVDYKDIDKKAFEDWAYSSLDNKGWRSYYAYETMKIFKEMSFGQARDQYYISIGRLLTFRYMFNEMRKAFENKKTREEKESVKKEKGGGK